MSKIKYILLFFVFITAKAYPQCKSGDCNNGRGTYDFGWCVYTGEFKDGKPEGKGVMNYDDYSYEGDFKNGIEDGKGIITYKNGTKESVFYNKGIKIKRDEKIAAADWKELEGQYDECISGNCITGFGTMRFPSGNKYVGNFVNRKRQGKGTFYFANGDKFEGTFKANLKDNGTYRFNNGYAFTGSFSNDDFYTGTFSAPSGNNVAMNNGKLVAQSTTTSFYDDDDDKSNKPVKKVKPKVCGLCHGTGTYTVGGIYHQDVTRSSVTDYTRPLSASKNLYSSDGRDYSINACPFCKGKL